VKKEVLERANQPTAFVFSFTSLHSSPFIRQASPASLIKNPIFLFFMGHFGGFPSLYR
jgi:hypothetical protein